MATDPEEDRPYFEDEEGGPVKSFLEHLEDLRWTLMKCVSAVGIGCVICLLGSPYLVKILKWPLERSEVNLTARQASVAVRFGTNWIGNFHPGPGQLGSLPFSTNGASAIEIVPILVGTNHFLSARIIPSDSVEIPFSSAVKILNMGPASSFYVAFQLAIYGGIVLASPFLIYFIAQFVLPALRLHEKKYLRQGFGIGTVLFLAGVSFCYFALMPVALAAAVRYSEWMGFESFQWTAELYTGFIGKFMLGMGLGFEMPLVILMLVRIGILTYAQLASFRRYMIVLNLVLGAVLTTPEVLTQVMMAIPLQFLYEVSVWVAWYWERQDKKRQAATEV
ncbi:MAG: twin-arginine translocase subunit TatC [Verrucomicrobia bacterium]|nr:twin-arginine translocase subunit TatC [Verrucomicrobiota bacterium]